MTSAIAMVLAAIFAVMLVVSIYRLDLAWELPINRVVHVAERTREVLADSQGTINVTCFMERRHPLFLPVSRVLRGIRRVARDSAGAEIMIAYADPRWDLAESARLSAAGITDNAVIFERDSRRVVVTLDDVLVRSSAMRSTEGNGRFTNNNGLGVFRGEAVFAAAIARLARPYEHAVIYWSNGHGETQFDDYNERSGFSDIAREIRREGFELRSLALAGLKQIPDDSRLLVMAGVRQPLAQEEVAVIEAYLSRGGRLLYMVVPGVESGLEKLIEQWGIRISRYIAASHRTLTGNDIVVDCFPEHPVTQGLRNSTVIFGYTVCLEVVEKTATPAQAFYPKAGVLVQSDPDGWGESKPGAKVRIFDPAEDLPGPVVLAAISELGGNISGDVFFRPTRICVFGESDFVSNGVLAARANANRDLFVNALYWLAGVDSSGASSLGGDSLLVTGLHRNQWIQFLVVASMVIPLTVFVVFSLVVFKRRCE